MTIYRHSFIIVLEDCKSQFHIVAILVCAGKHLLM